MTNIQEWWQSSITNTGSKNRMIEAMDTNFDKNFLSKCSWRGIGLPESKVEFKKFCRCRKYNICASPVVAPQLTFSSTNNREFEQIPLNWNLKLPLNCTSLREFRKRPLKSTVIRLFRCFLLDSLENDVSYRYSWSSSHFILK